MGIAAGRVLFLVVVIWICCGFSGASAEEVRLSKEGGVYHLPVTINDAIELKFVVDTGASDVHIPADVALTLIRTGTISKSDFRGEDAYQLADGSITRNAKLNLRSLQIGSRVIYNVEASTGPIEGFLLLGQSALATLEPWQLDTNKRVFILEESTGDFDTSNTSEKKYVKPKIWTAESISVNVTVNTPGDGYLALRNNPSTAGSRLLKIPHATDLVLGECVSTSESGRWCKTSYQGQNGWVSTRYLLMKGRDAEPKTGTVEFNNPNATVNSPGDGFLALRSNPNTNMGSRLLKIPHATDLVLGECVSTSESGRWCKTSYQGQNGWVSSRYLLMK